MSGLVESATALMSASQRRLEIIGNNIGNVSTPGYKRQVSFTDALGAPGPAGEALLPQTGADLAQGRLIETGGRLDLAISGAGLFALRDGEALIYSRHGQFARSADGRVVNAQGQALQADGADLVVGAGPVRIMPDGTVLEEGRPVARIALFLPAEGGAIEPLGGSSFGIDAAEEAPGAQLRQGMVEASNVSLGDEMVAMVATLRQAESGARLIQVYDELLGRAVTTFGGTGR